ncbi:MAG TPA: winged helix-turn-helix domain-containing protein [Pyrinomonadaceae bacterium]|nr:winged helix-turn-helix domain-containing protein [Pyrinomonadaceae bacterium]
MDTDEGVLRQSNEILPLAPKAIQALGLLVRNAGRVVSRVEMVETLWPDSFVEDSNLTVAISSLRRALGDNENGTKFIETVPKRGYRFVPSVRIGSSARPGRVNFTSMQIIRLTHNGHVLDVGISPDARLLAYVPIEMGRYSLWIWNLESGEKRQLLPPSSALCWGLRFTHNQEELFYITTQPNSTISVLNRMPVSGGESVKLVVNIDAPLALSPDGSQIAFVRCYPGQHKDVIIVAHVDGSNEREIASRQHPDKFCFSAASWSPDGKLIAIGASRNNELEFAVLGVPLDGSAPIELSQWDWKDVRAVEWSEDGSGLYCSATALHSKSLQIWRFSLRDGEKQRITNDPNNYEQISVAERAEALVTMQVEPQADIWIVPTSGAPRRITSGRTEGFDGLAIVAQSRIVYASTENNQSNLWSINADGSDGRKLTYDSGFFPSASSDGHLVAYVSAQGSTLHIWRMDADGANKKQLTEGAGESHPSISPDAEWIVYTPLGNGRNTLWKVSIDGGSPVQLTHNSMAIKPVVSPDGTMITCVYRRAEADKWKIALLSAAGGEPLKSFALPYPYNQVIRWSRDSKALIYVDRSEGVHNLWRQPLDDGAPTQLTSFTEDAIFYYDWLDDAGQLVVSRGVKTRDIVLIRNFE